MNSEMLTEFDALAATLRRIVEDRPLVFFVLAGNYGDSLIREGSERFFQHYGFEYSICDLRPVYRGKVSIADVIESTSHRSPVAVFNGGGALNSHYRQGGRIAKIAQQFDRSAILPSSIALDLSELDLPASTTVFVRDRYESQAAAPDAQFCHDMAFFLGRTEFGFPAGHGAGRLFRRDKERAESTRRLWPNLDISKRGNALAPVGGFLRKIASFEEVYTDRLHVGIAAALLGRKTHLYSNDYFKIRAIYRSSMQDLFPNVIYHDIFDPKDVPSMSFWRAIL